MDSTGSIGSNKGKRVVFCFWHGNQAGLFAYPHSNTVAVLCSMSRDGQLQARILQRLGFLICFGSSTRGGSAGLVSMIRRIRDGNDAAFAVDGPKGPVKQAKFGAIEAARQSDGVLVPIGVRANRAWVFTKAWDNYSLPKPFAQVSIELGPSLEARSTNSEALTTALCALE